MLFFSFSLNIFKISFDTVILLINLRFYVQVTNLNAFFRALIIKRTFPFHFLFEKIVVRSNVIMTIILNLLSDIINLTAGYFV